MFLKRTKKAPHTREEAPQRAQSDTPALCSARSGGVSYSNASLAFLGDAVFGLMVRERLVRQANRPAGKLHEESVKLVNARAQADAASRLAAVLTDEELAVYRRGRNSHTSHTPKNQSVTDYHSATGLECLFGFLYLKGQTRRLEELFGIIYEGEIIEQKQ